MRLALEITMDSAAFETCNGSECARILRDLAEFYDNRKVDVSPKEYCVIKDADGDRVGLANIFEH